MASFSWFYFLRFCTSAPHTNLPGPAHISRSPTLSGPDLNFLGTLDANEPLQDNQRLCHLSLSSFFSSLFSLLSPLHLKYTNPDSNAKFSGSPAVATSQSLQT